MRLISTALATFAILCLSAPAWADARSDSQALYRATIDARDSLIEIASTQFNGDTEAKALGDRIGVEVLTPLGGAFKIWFAAARAEVAQQTGEVVRGAKTGGEVSYAFDDYSGCMKASVTLGDYAHHFQSFLYGNEPSFNAREGAAPFIEALGACKVALGVDAETGLAE